MSRYCHNVEMQPTPLAQFDQHARNLGLCSVNEEVTDLRARLARKQISRNEALLTLNLISADRRAA